jgi:aconitate hydratase
VFARIDETYYERARQYARSGSLIVGGRNYGQGSSREHAAIAPRYLGVKAIIANGFARIHWQNLINFGVLPLTFVNPADWEKIDQNDVLLLSGLREAIQHGKRVNLINKTKAETYITEHGMTGRQIEMVFAGSLINVMRERHR